MGSAVGVKSTNFTYFRERKDALSGRIGYHYINHEVGISVRIHGLCRIEPGKIPHIVADFEDLGEICVLFCDESGELWLLLTEYAHNLLLSDDQRWNIFEDQRWFIYSNPEKLHERRNRVDLDMVRAWGILTKYL